MTETTQALPLYRLTRDQLAVIFTDPDQPAARREQARLEFDAKTDSVEDR